MTGIVRVVFVAHGIITVAAAIVLAVAPAAIPATVGIAVGPREALLSYFLAATELGIGVLSLGAARLRDTRAIRLIAVVFAVFHGATAVLELVYAATVASGPVLIANIAIRIVVTVLFAVIAARTRAPSAVGIDA